MLHDFHTHTSLSDGELSPMEMLRRAEAKGYATIGLTDHASAGDMERIVVEIVKACAMARQYWKILAMPGIELTHLPKGAIAGAARRAKELGAWIVVVHGETIVEPVEPGTDLAAVNCADVDILAHPGLITVEEVKLAVANGTFLEISARRGHSLTNGHVAKLARAAGAKMIVDSDAHTDHDLLSEAFANKVMQGAGLGAEDCAAILGKNAEELVKKILSRKKT